MGDMSDDEDKVRYLLKDGVKMAMIKLANNVLEALFIIALIFFAYNCNWCGGPRMW
jgi:hypothetical protein